MTISDGRTEQLDIIAGFQLALRVIFSGGTTVHVIVGFGELAAVD